MQIDFFRPYVLTHFQYITFKLNFPFVDTKKLIEIPSQLKTPTEVVLIHIDKYQLYKKQIEEKKDFSNKLRECILSNKSIENIINPIHNHEEIESFVFLKHPYKWIKTLC